jgi:hypothetical protein
VSEEILDGFSGFVQHPHGLNEGGDFRMQRE